MFWEAFLLGLGIADTSPEGWRTRMGGRRSSCEGISGRPRVRLQEEFMQPCVGRGCVNLGLLRTLWDIDKTCNLHHMYLPGRDKWEGFVFKCLSPAAQPHGINLMIIWFYYLSSPCCFPQERWHYEGSRVIKLALAKAWSSSHQEGRAVPGAAGTISHRLSIQRILKQASVGEAWLT